jgi:hypothetical protein
MMRASQGELVQQRSAWGLWQNKWFKIAVQALLLIGFSAATAFAKRLHPSMGIPSSSALFWLSMMVLARCTMNWHSAGTLVGVVPRCLAYRLDWNNRSDRIWVLLLSPGSY